MELTLRHGAFSPFLVFLYQAWTHGLFKNPLFYFPVILSLSFSVGAIIFFGFAEPKGNIFVARTEPRTHNIRDDEMYAAFLRYLESREREQAHL